MLFCFVTLELAFSIHRDALCFLNMEVCKPTWHYIPLLYLLTFYFRNSITKISIPFLINNQLSIFSNLTFPINHPVSPLSYYIKNPFSTISQSHSLIPSIEYIFLRYKNCAFVVNNKFLNISIRLLSKLFKFCLQCHQPPLVSPFWGGRGMHS